MGFGGFIGGVLLSILAVLLGLFGIVVLVGYFKSIATNLDIPLGIGLIVVALVLFLFGWYSYKSSSPDGTMDVHNQ
jgi:ammonia channel protein AmtB